MISNRFSLAKCRQIHLPSMKYRRKRTILLAHTLERQTVRHMLKWNGMSFTRRLTEYRSYASTFSIRVSTIASVQFANSRPVLISINVAGTPLSLSELIATGIIFHRAPNSIQIHDEHLDVASNRDNDSSDIRNTFPLLQRVHHPYPRNQGMSNVCTVHLHTFKAQTIY